ncbi:peptide chain release factor N(5)-glutamine methyltransferase [Spirochaeta dissipatitropha]
MTIREAREQLLSEICSETSILDLSVLIAYACGIAREQLYIEPERELSSSEESDLRSYCRRRSSGEPIAYITGKKEFYGRDFMVDKRVLIPRPDTEILVETALNLIAALQSEHFSEQIEVLDLCSGSGCVGITIAAETRSNKVVLSDIDSQALEISKINAETLLAPDLRPGIIQSNLFESIKDRFHLVVTNPPYVRDVEYKDLVMQKWKEPYHALVAEDEGLSIIRRLIKNAIHYIYPGGYIAIEAADWQADTIYSELHRFEYSEISHVKDLSGNRRVTTAMAPARQ